jgi:alcohol dehydrogenase
MLPAYYEFFCPVKILSGRKAVANLPYELVQMGASRPLVITDPGVAGAGLLKPVQAAFADSELEIATVFDETPTDSSTVIVNKVADLFREANCDCLVAVGGGSVIDTAKGVNIVVSEGPRICVISRAWIGSPAP